MLNDTLLGVIKLSVTVMIFIMLSDSMLGVVMLNVIVLSQVMLNAVMLSVHTPSVIMQSVIISSVVVPFLFSHNSGSFPSTKKLLALPIAPVIVCLKNPSSGQGALELTGAYLKVVRAKFSTLS
jgi:hypothetical protein